MDKQQVYVLFGEYSPEPFIAGIFSTLQSAEAALLEIPEDDRDRYVIDMHMVD